MNIMENEDLANIPLTQAVEPIIQIDGGFCRCARCHREVTPNNRVCPNLKCCQLQDWSWFGKNKRGGTK